jgi:hypothetical protein
VPIPKTETNLKLFLIGASVGLVYGIAIRFGSGLFPQSKAFSVMTLGFLLLVPFAMGFISVYLVERRKAQNVSVWILLPWIPVLGGTLAVVLCYWEGLICAVMFLPVGLLLASCGGLAAGVTARCVSSHKAKNITLGCILALPLLVTPWERPVFMRDEVRHVETTISIHAPADVVWRNIERVREIHTSELPISWSHRIGFPSPVEATLSSEGVGGIRHASFDGGVLFIETVDTWEPNHRLAFSIHAQTDQIPKTTLDDHVRVGGQYFDVLRGEYMIEAMPDGVVRLHLSSDHRLSTDFNWYARLWTDATMRDIQNTILQVIRNRCEADGAAGNF